MAKLNPFICNVVLYMQRKACTSLGIKNPNKEVVICSGTSNG